MRALPSALDEFQIPDLLPDRSAPGSICSRISSLTRSSTGS
jgi:hypothetical protein